MLHRFAPVGEKRRHEGPLLRRFRCKSRQRHGDRERDVIALGPRGGGATTGGMRLVDPHGRLDEAGELGVVGARVELDGETEPGGAPGRPAGGRFHVGRERRGRFGRSRGRALLDGRWLAVGGPGGSRIVPLALASPRQRLALPVLLSSSTLRRCQNDGQGSSSSTRHRSSAPRGDCWMMNRCAERNSRSSLSRGLAQSSPGRAASGRCA